ncbi:D-2-hydroxyacid dehydrogenase [Thalassolituus alkanivorans]|uniref:D-2-hydroxyacid dehydrogenase n=1 Tax=Thalassolituus alkanivorans TaxID=2881055 RepID=UPI001E4EDC1E|nr:D-2-hydroxyacid dehydrogenase [Thalassolituus alkanivorans]MCB2386838.1 D-2-hydroxyacid dehydrogenase [Thalassolituus alkanivorans]MCB2424997.1 D-2-hydroxyacid dehydrogenase [Thalassolituus alkanivorans]
MMKAVLLDADTLGSGVDLSPIRALVSELRVFTRTSPEQLEEHLADAELILTNKVQIPGWAMQGRKGILVLATGTNNIDMDAARAQGVPVRNVSNYGTHSVAQHTLMLMLALAARLPRYQHDIRGGAWQQSPFFCLLNHNTTELAGKTLVIVGQGTLGSAVAKLAEAFGMTVMFCARPGAEDDSRLPFELAIEQADVLSFHCPLNEHTRHLLNRDNIDRLKRGCLVVNCARGGIIDEMAALWALQSGHLGGLAVDVLPVEPPDEGHPLLSALKQGNLNLIVTPHNAWISPQARQNIINLTADNIRMLA